MKYTYYSKFINNNNNNNNDANICIARLKQNSSGVLMAQTNTVSVFVQMTTVTASGVADQPEDCSKLLLRDCEVPSAKCSIKYTCAKIYQNR